MYWIRLRTSTSTSDIGTCEVGWLCGLVAIMGHVSGPLEMHVLKLVYMKDLVSEKVHACGAYSTFRSSTNKYPLKTSRSKSARVFREKLYA